MKTVALKNMAVAICMIVGLVLFVVSAAVGSEDVKDTDPVVASQDVKYTDAATYYKDTKCGTCHGKNAEKKFDVAKPDDEHVQIILKGKKAEKPPHMPGYEAKGLTADQAKEVLAYMKTLRQ